MGAVAPSLLVVPAQKTNQFLARRRRRRERYRRRRSWRWTGGSLVRQRASTRSRTEASSISSGASLSGERRGSTPVQRRKEVEEDRRKKGGKGGCERVGDGLHHTKRGSFRLPLRSGSQDIPVFRVGREQETFQVSTFFVDVPVQKVPGHIAVVLQEIPGTLVAEKIQVPFVETQERTQLRTKVPFVAVCHSLERIVEVGVAQTPWRWTSHILTQTRHASTSTNYDFHCSNCCNYYCYHYCYYCCYWIPVLKMSPVCPLSSWRPRQLFTVRCLRAIRCLVRLHVCPSHVPYTFEFGCHLDQTLFTDCASLFFSLVTSETALHHKNV